MGNDFKQTAASAATSTPKRKSRKGTVTLQDVASALGVSKGTVSMALKGNELVAEKTRQAVLQKVRELGYVYNRGAASLSTGVTGLVGLAVHNLTNPYFATVCASIEAELEKEGQFALLCNLDESLEKQARFLRALTEQNADGLIICPAAGTSTEDLLAFREHGAVVLFARDLGGNQFDFVGNDDEKATMMSTHHVIALGHRRIAYIGGGSETSVARYRREGFVAAMKQAGLGTASELMIDSSLHPEGGAEATRALLALAKPPTAIVCFTDFVALGAISALHEGGKVPGKDIAVIGCDGIAEGERAYINLSTINVQKRLIGETAARLLQQRLQNPDGPIQHITTEPVAAFRASCGELNTKSAQSRIA